MEGISEGDRRLDVHVPHDRDRGVVPKGELCRPLIGSSSLTSSLVSHRTHTAWSRALYASARAAGAHMIELEHPKPLRLWPGAVYFADANPSAHENSRNSSFGADAFVYVRTEVKGSSNAFGSVTVIRSSRTPGEINRMRSVTVN